MATVSEIHQRLIAIIETVSGAARVFDHVPTGLNATDLPCYIVMREGSRYDTEGVPTQIKAVDTWQIRHYLIEWGQKLKPDLYSTADAVVRELYARNKLQLNDTGLDGVTGVSVTRQLGPVVRLYPEVPDSPAYHVLITTIDINHRLSITRKLGG